MTGEKLRPYDEKNNYIIEMGYRYVHIFNFYLVIYSFYVFAQCNFEYILAQKSSHTSANQLTHSYRRNI